MDIKRGKVSQQFTLTRWQRDDPPQEAELTQLMEQAGYRPALRGEPPGTRHPVHHHPYPEMCWVISGWVRYNFPGADAGQDSYAVLKAGDRIEVPADIPHDMSVEGAAYAVYLTSSPLSLPLAHSSA